MFPGLGLGQTNGFPHGGTPSDVFMRSERFPDTCAPIGVNTDGVTVMPLQVDVPVPSHLLAFFSFEFVGLDTHESAQVGPIVAGEEALTFSRFTGNQTGSHEGNMVMSSFPNVDPGTHTVEVSAAVAGNVPLPGGSVHGSLFATLENCSLTVIVTPVAPPPPA
jgi:hypothetical protein